jgi:hypothetical protein
VATLTQLIQAHTVTSLSVAPNRSSFGERVELLATVRTAAPGTVTGNVTFVDGGDHLGFLPLDASGEARLSISSLPAGEHILSAHFEGDTRFSPSAGQTAHQVDRAATSAAITASAAPIIEVADER